MIVVSELMAEYIRKVYGVRGVTVVPPGGRVRGVSGNRKYEPPYKVIFAGSVTYRERVDLFVKSLPYVVRNLRSGLQAYITNKGDMVSEVRGLARRLRVPVKFFWFEDANSFLQVLSKLPCWSSAII